MLRQLWRRVRRHKDSRSEELIENKLVDVIRKIKNTDQIEETLGKIDVEKLISTKSPEELLNIGNILFKSDQQEQLESKKQAVLLWKAAAQKGNASAAYSYAMCVRSGEGVKEPNPSLAVKYLTKLAEHNHPWAIFALGNAYRIGEGVEKDEARAFSYFNKSAELGIAPSFFNISNMYLNGNGVEQSETNSIKWLKKGVAVGDPEAKFHLALRSATGNGVTQDLDGSVQLLWEASEQGHPLACYNLGCHYLKESSESNRDSEELLLKAKRLFQNAANRGNTFAMMNLAVMYRDGRGVSKNIEEARKWLLQASKYNEEATLLLNELDQIEN